MTENVEGMMPGQDSLAQDAISQMDMASLIRSSAGDGLKAIPGIEEIVVGLTKTLRNNMVSFTKEDIEYNFIGMRIFDGISDAEIETILKIRIGGKNESRIAAVIAYPEPVRHALSILLGGKTKSAKDFGEGDLRPSEDSLFLLFADQMIKALASTIDLKKEYGEPESPQISNKKEFRQFCADRDFVALEFSIGFEEAMKEFELLVPLEMFDLIKLADDEELEDDVELTEEELWHVSLGKNINNLAVPMDVELCAMEMSLSRLAGIQIGETLSVRPTKSGLKIIDDTGATAFIAELEIHNKRFGLRVTEQRQKEEA